VVLSVLVTFLSALGGYLIKYAYNIAKKDVDELNGGQLASAPGAGDQEKPAKVSMSTARGPVKAMFIFGNLSIAFLGPILDIAALTMAAQSLIIPIAGLTIVWNFLLATFALKEKWNRYNVISMILICFGVGIIAVYGSHDSSNKPLPVLLCLFHNLAFLVYFALFLIGSFLLLILWKAPSTPQYIKSISAAILPGAIGGNQFFIKAVGELIVLAANGTTYWSYLSVYIISLFGVTFAVLQLVLLNKALRDYDALLVVPLYQAALILTGSVSGGIFFIEFDGFSYASWAGYFTGLVAVLGGVGIVFFSGKNDEVGEEGSGAEKGGRGGEGEADESMDVVGGTRGESFDNPVTTTANIV
jgi:hypothetical protein